MVVVDTSIFIEFLRVKEKTKSNLYRIPDHIRIFISAITLYELLMGATNKQKIYDIEALTQDIVVLPFDGVVAKKASEIYLELRHKNKMIEFRDIFIGATSIINNMPLFTLNRKHFDRIKGIKIYDFKIEL